MDLGRELVDIGLGVAGPLIGIATEPAAAVVLLQRSGWDPAGVVGLGHAELADAAKAVAATAASVQAILEAQPPSGIDLVDLARTLAAVGDVIGDLRSLGAGWSPVDGLPANLPALLLEDLLGQLAALYLADRHPALRAAAEALGVLTYQASTPITTASGRVVRSGVARPRVDVSVLGRLLTDPKDVLETRLGLKPVRRPADAVADDVFPVVATLLRAVGLTAWYGDPGGDTTGLTEAQVQLLKRLLRVVWVHTEEGVGRAVLDVGLALRDEGVPPKRILVAYPTGSLQYARELDTWKAEAAMTGRPGLVVIGSSGVRFEQTAQELRLSLTVERPPSGVPIARLGAVGGPGLELDSARIEAEVVLSPVETDVGVNAALKGVKLIFAAPAGDGFLTAVRPAGGMPTVFDVEAEWSLWGGLRLGGSAGLDVTLPANLQLGLVTVVSAHLSVKGTPEGVTATAAGNLTVRLGPVSAAIERMGVEARLLPAQHGGSLGPVDFSVAVAPPRGVALSIDAGAVTGGGFLFFDSDKKQYAGAMHLVVEGGLALNAFGLLTTRMPDGSPGFSLLILVQASGFEPIPLGFGFRLTGVGGLLGINRTVNVEVLRAGVRSRVLDSILFSQDDPTPRAAQILSTLNTVFPPAGDRYVFGPMVQLEWGTPVLVTIEVALILELPSPLRLIVLGRLHALLPVADAPIVTLHLDAVGVLDFGRRAASVDATLYDSFVGPFALSGDMALRVSWGDQPEFALAIGGFNPAFKPPAGFPALRRLTLALADGDNPRVRAEAYLAVTANTLQLGARLELRVEAEGFVLEGGMGFDTLVTRVPFGFEVDIAAYLALKRDGSTIMGIDLRANLAGPNPWHLKGSVSFTILFLSVTIPIDATFGDTRQVPGVRQEPVWPKLKEALEAPGNWAAELPADAGRLAVLSPAPPDPGEVIVHPLGAVRILQRVVPLERTIARFGAAPPQDYSRFAITEAVGADRDSVVYDSFAPVQFLEMSDADKLSAPGFERMPAGVRLRAPEDASAFGSAASRPLRYETIAIGGPAAGTRFEPDAATIAQQAERGAAAGAATRTTGRAKFGVETPPPRVAEPAFDVTDVTHLNPKPHLTDGTYSAALEAAGLYRDVQVVRRAELAVP